jgi:hypothetical protein
MGWIFASLEEQATLFHIKDEEMSTVAEYVKPFTRIRCQKDERGLKKIKRKSFKLLPCKLGDIKPKWAVTHQT